MPSIAEDVMRAVLARLEGIPSNGNLRRAHRTTIVRDKAPAIRLVDGVDTPQPAKNTCRTDRTKAFTVTLFGRDDAGVAMLDDTIVAVNARLNPMQGTPYPGGAVLRQLRITPDEEIADGDAIRVDMDFEFDYETPGWAL